MCRFFLYHCFTVLLIASIASCAKGAEVLVSVSAGEPTSQTLRPVWTRTNIWDISQIPTERRTSVVREMILMTATGGRPTNNMASLNERGELQCDFTSLTLAIDKVLDLKIEPVIVLGNVPDCLTSGSEIRNFEVNTRPPRDYALYQEYIEKLVAELVRRYGMKRTVGWEYRLMTEPDNTSWWTDADRNEYRRLYDATVAAARRAAPKIIISGGNYMDLYPHPNSWQQWWPEWLAKGEASEFPGALPRQIREISFSCYGGMYSVQGLAGQLGPDPRYLVTLMENLRNHSTVLGYPVKFSIAEGQMLFDENRKYLWLGDGTELGAAWNAAMIKLAHDTDLHRIVQWGWCGLADGNLRSPVYNTIVMFETMLGQRIMQSNTQITGAIPPSSYVDTIATRNKKNKLSVLVFHFNYDRASTVTLPVVLKIHDKSHWTLEKHWRVDRTRSNFMTRWLADSTTCTMVDRGNNSGSRYDLDIVHVLDDRGVSLWNRKKKEYKKRKLDKLIQGKQETVDDPVTSETTVKLTMPANSVSLFVFQRE